MPLPLLMYFWQFLAYNGKAGHSADFKHIPLFGGHYTISYGNNEWSSGFIKKLNYIKKIIFPTLLVLLLFAECKTSWHLTGDFISVGEIYNRKRVHQGKHYLLLKICEDYWKMTLCNQNINFFISRKNLKSKLEEKLDAIFLCTLRVWRNVL